MPTVRWWVAFLCTYLIPPEWVEPVVTFFIALPRRFDHLWSAPIGDAWNITNSGSFYRVNATATLLWLFSTVDHRWLVGMFVLSAIIVTVMAVYLLAKATRWIPLLYLTYVSLFTRRTSDAFRSLPSTRR